MLSRRTLFFGGATLAAGGAVHGTVLATVVPPPGLLYFDVSRNGSRIGEHVVRLSRSGATVRADISVEIAVGIGPITLYRYTHTVREEWQDTQFQWMEARTNDDGTQYRVHAERMAKGVVVRRHGGDETVMTADTIPLTHWNDACLRAPLFNPQTGLPLNMAVQPRDTEMIDLGSGRMIRARRYSLVGEETLDTWYDHRNAWAALRSAGRDGSTIAYRRAT
jgi:hypothetical protein